MEGERKEGRKFQLFANQSLIPRPPIPKEVSRAAFISDTLNETLSEYVSLILFPWLSPKIAGTCQSGSLQEGLQYAYESTRSAQH